jgi:hypothetical protein
MQCVPQQMRRRKRLHSANEFSYLYDCLGLLKKQLLFIACFSIKHGEKHRKVPCAEDAVPCRTANTRAQHPRLCVLFIALLLFFCSAL